jgi:hypothetical protein
VNRNPYENYNIKICRHNSLTKDVKKFHSSVVRNQRVVTESENMYLKKASTLVKQTKTII